MLRPSISRGWPALGCAESFTVATRARRSIVSSIAAGPTLQFSPTTSAPQRSSSGTNASGARAVAGVAVFLGRHLRDDRQVADRAHAANRGADLVDVAEGLEHEEIDAAFDERARLLGEVLLRLVDAGLAPGLDANAERTDRARRPTPDRAPRAARCARPAR